MEHTKFFLLISFIHYAYPLNYDELIQPKCEGKTIKYSIIADLKGYLLKDNDNIDGRDLYGKVEDLKSKKVGIIKGSYVTPGTFDNLIPYEKLNDILRDLRNHKLDAIIVDDGVCNYTQAFGDDLSLLKGYLGINYVGFAVQKGNETLLKEINDLLASNDTGINIGKKKDWYILEEEQKYDHKILTGERGSLNILFRLEYPPYAYIKDGEPTGSEVALMYLFAERYGYKFNLSQAFTIQDQIDCLKNKTFDIAGGLLPILDEYKNDVDFSNVFHPTEAGIIVRYGNHIEFGNSIYDSIV